MIKNVATFQDLVATPFAGGVNALCLKRRLVGDFAEVMRAINATEPITVLDEVRLKSLSLTADGFIAVALLLEDMRLLRDLGRDPVLNLISGYPRDEEAAVVATDVFSWHADSAPIEADTWLCTYHGAPSEGLRNDDAIRKVDVPEIRAQLLDLYQQSLGESLQVCSAISAEPPSGLRFQVSAFTAWLSENCYDLHYAAKPGAVPHSFGVGNLWRIAVEWPGSSVPPCVHRAPATIAGQPRLLLI